MFNSLSARGLHVSHLGHTLVQRTTRLERILRRFRTRSDPAPAGQVDFIDESRRWVNELRSELAHSIFDVIFAPVASAEVAFLETSTPIVYLSDATFRLMRGYYALYSNLPENEARALEELESRAISKSHRLVYSSSWAADSAIAHYGAPPNRVRVIPFGANLDEVPSTEAATQKQSGEVCRLLFLGRDWERKGGNIAFECLLALLKSGLNAELIVGGCTPPREARHDRLVVVGLLDKNKPRQRRQLSRILLDSHFLILPTQADCTPIVLCEANAFGLPAVSTRTGGIPSVIEEGCNGVTLPLGAKGEDFARVIAQIFRDQARYEAMVVSARHAYDQRLNWRSWASSMHQELSDVAASSQC